MHVVFLFLTCALLVGNVACECNKYIECFGEFLRDFFGNVHFLKSDKVNVTNDFNKTLTYEFSDTEDVNLDRVISDITSIIKEIDGNIKETDIINRNDSKTKIVVKTFEKDDDFIITDFTEKEPVSTTEIIYTDDIIFGDLTVTPTEDTITEDSFKVIPLDNKNERDNEIFDDDINSYNDAEEATFVTDYPDIDYIELYKDTTNEYVKYETTEVNKYAELNDLRAEIDKQEKEIENLINHSLHMANDEALAEVVKNVTDHNVLTSGPDDIILKGVAPWIATIFLKNKTGDQFDYYCDGALVSDKAVLTAARCANNGNGSYSTENFIVILGKTSLQISGSNEKILRVKEVKSHENFTIQDGVTKNDVALLILEEPVILNDGISISTISITEDNQNELESNITMTTAWGPSGDIALIYFDKEKSKACEPNNKVENTFCATYGDDVALCPSYGGLYVTKQADQLCLAGIRTGDPSDRGICFNKQVSYTSLKNYTQWMSENIEV